MSSDPSAFGAHGDRWRSSRVWVDGRLHPVPDSTASGAAASLRDAFVADETGPLGLLETLRVEQGRALHFEEHVQRLRASARALGIPQPDPAELERGARELLAAVAEEAPRVFALRLAVVPTRGLFVSARAATPFADAGVVVTTSSASVDPGGAGVHKTTRRAAYRRAREEARARDAWDGLLRGVDGTFVESSIANLFAVVDGRLVVPGPAQGALRGLQRERLLSRWSAWKPAGLVSGAPEERGLSAEELLRADELFLTNEVAGVVPVRQLLAGEAVRSLVLGPWTREARRAVESARERADSSG